MSPGAWAAFVAAAAVGAMLRYLVDGAFARRGPAGLPSGTLFVNATGSFVLGLLTGLALYHGFAITSKIVLGTGFCGAYTTFSAFTFETVRLVEEGSMAVALRNVLGTVVICTALAALGLAAAAL